MLLLTFIVTSVNGRPFSTPSVILLDLAGHDQIRLVDHLFQVLRNQLRRVQRRGRRGGQDEQGGQQRIALNCRGQTGQYWRLVGAFFRPRGTGHQTMNGSIHWVGSMRCARCRGATSGANCREQHNCVNCKLCVGISCNDCNACLFLSPILGNKLTGLGYQEFHDQRKAGDLCRGFRRGHKRRAGGRSARDRRRLWRSMARAETPIHRAFAGHSARRRKHQRRPLRGSVELAHSGTGRTGAQRLQQAGWAGCTTWWALPLG